MRYLLKGCESEELVDLLLKLTKINSESVTDAIKDHLVRGMSENDAAMLNHTTRQKVDRAMDRLNVIAGVVEDINELKLIKPVK